MSRFLARALGLLVGVSVAAAVAGSIAAARFKKNAPPPPDAGADEINLAAVMESAAFASTAGSFRGGRAICWYGALDLDLREASFDPAGADLEVRTAFGGTRILVAPGVAVTTSGPVIFGGKAVRPNSASADIAGPGLRITGFSVFGGLEIVAAEPDAVLRSWVPERSAG